MRLRVPTSPSAGPWGERERGAAIHDLTEQLGRGQTRSTGEAEGVAELDNLGGAEHAADHVLAAVGGEPAHPHVAVRHPVPDRQQQSGDEPEPGFGMGRQAGDFGLPQRAPLFLVRLPPGRTIEFGAGHGLAGGGVDQADAVLDAPVLQHARHVGQDQRGSVGTLVGHQVGFASGTRGLSPKRKCCLGGQRFQLVAALDLAELGDGAGGLVREHRLS